MKSTASWWEASPRYHCCLFLAFEESQGLSQPHMPSGRKKRFCWKCITRSYRIKVSSSSEFRQSLHGATQLRELADTSVTLFKKQAPPPSLQKTLTLPVEVNFVLLRSESLLGTWQLGVICHTAAGGFHEWIPHVAVGRFYARQKTTCEVFWLRFQICECLMPCMTLYRIHRKVRYFFHYICKCTIKEWQKLPLPFGMK